MSSQEEGVDESWSMYAGRWIASVDGRIIGQGGTPEQALWAAINSRHKETPRIAYIPTMQPLILSERLEQISQVLPPGGQVYLVGGAVRDALLGRVTRDLDFVMKDDALRFGRQVADFLGGAYYPLDEERQTARVIVRLTDGSRESLDFSVFHGEDLESDLRSRDFTINAMALEVSKPQELLDPFGGAADLQAKHLRICSPDAIKEDPIRIMRGVRLAAAYTLRIQRDSLNEMRKGVDLLEEVSVERKRDELFRILDGPQPVSAIRALEMIGALEYVLPELISLKGVSQSSPHTEDVWMHSLSVLRELENVLGVLAQQYNEDKSASLMAGLLSMRLGRYRVQISAHLDAPLVPERTVKALLFLAALYHDIAKPQTRQVEGTRVRFIGHELIGEELARQRGLSLHLSNDEVNRLATVIRNHLRPLLLGQGAIPPTRKAIYRFFRQTGAVGVDICLLSLADVLATHGTNLPQELWSRQLDVVRDLLEAWWEQRDELVTPPALIDGHQLMQVFGLPPGRHIAELLEAIREGQATGVVLDEAGALALARSWMEDNKFRYG